jgi:GNAT superfamily N-acetyltransferase
MPELTHPFPPGIAALFDRSMVNAACVWGVLEGVIPGVIAVDDVNHPTWAVGRMSWNTGFAAGHVDCAEPAEATRQLARWGEFGIFRGEDEADIPGALGRTDRFEFLGPRRALPPIQFPTGCRIVPVDAGLLKRCQWGSGTSIIWGGADRFLERGIGFCLLRDDDGEILCEVPTFAIGAGKAEISVITHADHRGKGFAKLSCRHAAGAYEARGLMPTYSCDQSNHASVAVGRSLGFSVERSYRSVRYGAEKSECC